MFLWFRSLVVDLEIDLGILSLSSYQHLQPHILLPLRLTSLHPKSALRSLLASSERFTWRTLLGQTTLSLFFIRSSRSVTHFPGPAIEMLDQDRYQESYKERTRDQIPNCTYCKASSKKGHGEHTAFPFLRLPAELRNKIYRCLLLTAYTKYHVSYYSKRWTGPYVKRESLLVILQQPFDYALYKIWPKYAHRYQTSIFRLNHQICRETLTLFYAKNEFVYVRCKNTELEQLWNIVGLAYKKDVEGKVCLTPRLTISRKVIAMNFNTEVIGTAFFCPTSPCNPSPLIARSFFSLGSCLCLRSTLAKLMDILPGEY